MKFFWIFLSVSGLYAVEPIFNNYEDPSNIWGEFRNMAGETQNKKFIQVTSTPNLSEMGDGEIFIYTSTQSPTLTDIHFILRSGTTLYYTPNFKIVTGR